jgi:hypothetical protein
MKKSLAFRVYWICWVVCAVVFGISLAMSAVAAEPLPPLPGLTDSGEVFTPGKALDVIEGRLQMTGNAYRARMVERFNSLTSGQSWIQQPNLQTTPEPWISLLATDLETVTCLTPGIVSQASLYPTSLVLKQAEQQTAPMNEVPVPLPAAIWLFASALTGYVAFSSRRNI